MKQITTIAIIGTILIIFSSLALAQENCTGNLTMSCAGYNQSDCPQYYLMNISYFQCSWNVAICIPSVSNCNLINIPAITQLDNMPINPVDSDNINITATCFSNETQPIVINYWISQNSILLYNENISVNNNLSAIIFYLTADNTTAGDTFDVNTNCFDNVSFSDNRTISFLINPDATTTTTITTTTPTTTTIITTTTTPGATTTTTLDDINIQLVDLAQLDLDKVRIFDRDTKKYIKVNNITDILSLPDGGNYTIFIASKTGQFINLKGSQRAIDYVYAYGDTALIVLGIIGLILGIIYLFVRRRKLGGG